MKKTLFITLLLLLAASQAFAGTWVPALDSARAPRLPETKVVKADSQSLIVEMTVPGFIKSEQIVNGNAYTKVSLPNAASLMEKGMPELPKFTSLIQLPNDGGLAVKILDSEYKDIQLESPVLSSKGHLLRNVNPSDIPYEFNSYYDTDEWYPAEKNVVSAGTPFIFRDVRGARAEYTPFVFNPSENTLRVYTKLRVLFAFVAGGENIKKLRRAPLGSVSDFTQSYKNLFINYTPSNNYTQKEEIGKLSIIAYDDFYNAALPLKTWKLKTGLETELVKLSDIGANEKAIKDFIADRYEQGYVFFIIVGDEPQVPTMRGIYERAASDTCYTKIEGNDNVPDAFISRLSGTTVADIENQVTKIINYESKPTVNSPEWYTKAIGIASHEGNPTDYARCDELHESLDNYTFTQTDEHYAYSYSNQPTASAVADSINDGRSLINYIGHGSKTQWVTSNFTNNHVKNLKNGSKLPVIWSVACQNGSFIGTSDCFAEAWLKAGSKTKPAGAIAVLASSTNAAWVPPCVMQAEIIHNLLCKEQKFTFGGQATNGVLKAMEVYGTTDKSQGNMLMEQHTLFGDCSMLIRSKTPQKVEMSAQRTDSGLTVKVTSQGRSVNNARVAVYNQDMSKWESSLTDSEGRAQFTSNDNNILCTVTGSNLVPIIDAPVK